MSLSTTRELCAVAGAQDVVRGHIELFGMLLYVYSEGVETIIRSVSYLNFRAPRDRAPPYQRSELQLVFLAERSLDKATHSHGGGVGSEGPDHLAALRRGSAT